MLQESRATTRPRPPRTSLLPAFAAATLGATIGAGLTLDPARAQPSKPDVAPPMPLGARRAFDDLIMAQYRQCWDAPAVDAGGYIPEIRVQLTAEGKLALAPVLINPPADEAGKALADSALRAVRRCDPLKFPFQFAYYHAQWKKRLLRFDPRQK